MLTYYLGTRGHELVISLDNYKVVETDYGVSNSPTWEEIEYDDSDISLSLNGKELTGKLWRKVLAYLDKVKPDFRSELDSKILEG